MIIMGEVKPRFRGLRPRREVSDRHTYLEQSFRRWNLVGGLSRRQSKGCMVAIYNRFHKPEVAVLVRELPVMAATLVRIKSKMLLPVEEEEEEEFEDPRHVLVSDLNEFFCLLNVLVDWIMRSVKHD